jgi:hypothetical protein
MFDLPEVVGSGRTTLRTKVHPIRIKELRGEPEATKTGAIRYYRAVL